MRECGPELQSPNETWLLRRHAVFLPPSSLRRSDRLPAATSDLPRAIVKRADEIVALDAALERLEELDAPLARIVELRFFAGLSVEETAEVVGCSARTVKRDWRKARALLHADLTSGVRPNHS